MKKLIPFLSLILISFVSSAQSYYKATITEMYTYNRSTEEWELYQKNSDMNITVVIEEKFISFQAKTPSMYRIYENSKEVVKTKSLEGYRYFAKDLKEEKTVKIDILASEEQKAVLVSIINVDEGYNLRFFLTKIIE